MSERDQSADPGLAKATEDAEKIAATLGRLYLGLLGFGVYLFVTLSVNDAVLVRADAEIDIPVFGISARLSHILVFAPFCLVALTFYLHLFYGQLLALKKRGVQVSQAFLFTMPGRTANTVAELIFYAFLPLVLAWSSWKALFRPEAPFLVALTLASMVVLAIVHQRRSVSAAWPLPIVARAATGLAAALAIGFVGYASWVGWQGLVEKRSIDLVNADLSRADLSGVDLKDLNLTRANLDGANLSYADLRGANFSNATLRKAELIGANLENAILQGANLDGALFEQQLDEMTNDASADGEESSPEVPDVMPCFESVTSANLAHTDFRGARLTEAVLRGVDLRWSDLTKSDLRQADLSCARLDDSTMTGANLIRTSLFGVKAPNANLTEARLGFADLRGANFTEATLPQANLDGAIVGDTTFAFAKLGGASLLEWIVTGQVLLTGANLTNSTPSAAHLCKNDKDFVCAGIIPTIASDGRASIER